MVEGSAASHGDLAAGRRSEVDALAINEPVLVEAGAFELLAHLVDGGADFSGIKERHLMPPELEPCGPRSWLPYADPDVCGRDGQESGENDLDGDGNGEKGGGGIDHGNLS